MDNAPPIIGPIVYSLGQAMATVEFAPGAAVWFIVIGAVLGFLFRWLITPKPRLNAH